MDRVDPSRRNICPVYETFADCPNGNNCEDIHVDFPFDTNTIMATIVSHYWKTPENVEFLLEGAEEMTYFIPGGARHCFRAKQNDTVKLQVSERRRNDGNRFARIVEVLSPCGDFAVFSDCKHGGTCKWAHHCLRKQNFHIAKVLSIAESDRALEVELKHESEITCEIFHVPNKDNWHLKNAAMGNLVILQESSRCHFNRTNFGKIISVLHESQSLQDSHFPLERELRRGFAIEQFKGRHPDIVIIYSVESCLDHSDCKRIGIHIFAGALENFSKKIDEFFVPQHRANRRKGNYECFRADSIRIAISLYTHSATKKVDGPMLTPVFLPRERIINVNAGESVQPEIIEAMWKVFGEDLLKEDADKAYIAGFMVDCPLIWKTAYLIYKMRNFANKQLTRYLQELKNENFAFAKNEFSYVGIPDEEVVVPVEIANIGLNHLPGNERKIELATILGFVKRSIKMFWEQRPKEANPFVYDTVACGEISKNKDISMTSPIGVTTDYVNQQILLFQMISPGKQLYSKNELLGILVRRFENPTMYTTMVTHVEVKDSIDLSIIDLHICGIMKRRRGNLQLMVGEIFKGAKLDYSTKPSKDDDGATDSKSISFLLKGLTCDEYCNTKLVSLPGKRLAALDNALDVFGAETSEITKQLRELNGSKTEFDAPYEKEDLGTKVSLQRCVKLQLEMLELSDLGREPGDFLCLLKIGKNCHLCLIHLTSPKCAFRSNRSDTNELIPRSALDEMKIAINENRLRTSLLKQMSIKWDDCYFSGGTFYTNMKIKAGNLLCIRREISTPNFVWISHGVVSEIYEDKVKFLVCSLNQDQTPNMFQESDDDNFIIEVIDVTTEETGSSCEVHFTQTSNFVSYV